MNRIRKGFAGLLLTTFIFTNGHAQTQLPEVHQFSIKQAIDYAYAHNAQVKNALLDLQIQQQTNRFVKWRKKMLFGRLLNPYQTCMILVKYKMIKNHH